MRFAGVLFQLLIFIQCPYPRVWNKLLVRNRTPEHKKNRLMRLQFSRKEETKKSGENQGIQCYMGGARGGASRLLPGWLAAQVIPQEMFMNCFASLPSWLFTKYQGKFYCLIIYSNFIQRIKFN